MADLLESLQALDRQVDPAEEIRPDVFLFPRAQRFGVRRTRAAIAIGRELAVDVLFAHFADGAAPENEEFREPALPRGDGRDPSRLTDSAKLMGIPFAEGLTPETAEESWFACEFDSVGVFRV
jgi:hypothetical protein